MEHYVPLQEDIIFEYKKKQKDEIYFTLLKGWGLIKFVLLRRSLWLVSFPLALAVAICLNVILRNPVKFTTWSTIRWRCWVGGAALGSEFFFYKMKCQNVPCSQFRAFKTWPPRLPIWADHQKGSKVVRPWVDNLGKLDGVSCSWRMASWWEGFPYASCLIPHQRW